MVMIGKRPFPDGHPLKGGLILFGSGIPEAWKAAERERKKKREQTRIEAEIPEKTPDNLPDDLEVQAFNNYEEALARSISNMEQRRKGQTPSSESTAVENPESCPTKK